MMSDRPDPIDPEDLWGRLLSRQADEVRATFAGLAPDQQTAVLAHLIRMVEEEGWHPEQRQSAQAALQALGKGPATSA
jgi:hypothetical protein